MHMSGRKSGQLVFQNGIKEITLKPEEFNLKALPASAWIGPQQDILPIDQVAGTGSSLPQLILFQPNA